MVVAGLMIGNHGRSFAMSDTTRDHLAASGPVQAAKWTWGAAAKRLLHVYRTIS